MSSYDLTLDVEDDLVTFDAVAEISLRPTESLDELRFDLDGLKVNEATIDGVSCRIDGRAWTWCSNRRSRCPPTRPWRSGSSMRARPNREDRGARRAGVDRQPRNGQLRGAGTRRRQQLVPGQRPPWRQGNLQLRDHHPEGVEAVANGTRTGMETKDSRTTWSWSARDPMATYLATVAIGQYTFFEGEAPGGLPLLSAVADEVVERAGRAAVERALGELPQMVTVLSQRFGPYPFEIYGVIVVAEPLGFALETQTRSIFGDDLWAVPVIQAHELPTSGTATRWAGVVGGHLAQRGIRHDGSGCGRRARAGGAVRR
ncbi:MAG: hypothetical protein R2704_12520 [Microthrixaceae bacterium]